MMKKLQILALTILFTITGITIELQAMAFTTPTITNNSNTPPNAITLSFFDSKGTQIGTDITIFYNGQSTIIPPSAVAVSGFFVRAKNSASMPVLKKVSITPGKSYSITNPNSANNASAPWVLTTV